MRNFLIIFCKKKKKQNIQTRKKYFVVKVFRFGSSFGRVSFRVCLFIKQFRLSLDGTTKPLYKQAL